MNKDGMEKEEGEYAVHKIARDVCNDDNLREDNTT